MLVQICNFRPKVVNMRVFGSTGERVEPGCPPAGDPKVTPPCFFPLLDRLLVGCVLLLLFTVLQNKVASRLDESLLLHVNV